jgi:GNAT superfamily N-acetyltransferase
MEGCFVPLDVALAIEQVEREAQADERFGAPPAVREAVGLERGTPAHAEGVDQAMREAFGAPTEVSGWMGALIERDGWHVYVALDGATVVATGSFFARAEAAWLGITCTRPAHRGRGAQSALLAARIEGARAVGARWLSLETDDDTPEKPNPSHRNVARAGFAVAYRREIWAPT